MKKIVVEITFWPAEWETVDDAYEQYVNTLDNQEYYPGRMERFIKLNLLQILRDKLKADPKYAPRVRERSKNDDK